MVFNSFDAKTFFIFVIIHVIIVIQCVFTLTYVLFKAKKTPTAYSMIVCQFLILLWLFFRFPENMATTTEELLFSVRFTLFPIYFIGVAWLIFAMFYTECKAVYKKKTIILLVTPIIITFLPVLTNKYFHLIIVHKTVEDPLNTQWGLFFWIYWIINYTYVFIGILLVIKKSISVRCTYRVQIILLLISVIIPVSSNLIGFAKLIYIPFDITPISFSISFMLLTISIYKFRLLDISPFAIKEVFDSMHECVLIIDRSNNIIDFNNSFVSYFGKYIHIEKEQSYKGFFQSLENYTANIEDLKKTLSAIEINPDCSLEMQLTIGLNENKMFLLNTKPVYKNKKNLIGRIFTFKDITSYQKLFDEISVKNEELSTMNKELMLLNEQLKEYSQSIEQLTLEKERNRFSRELHDTMGHTLTLLIAMLKATRINYYENPSKSIENLDDAIEIAQAGMNELRMAIAGLDSPTINKSNLYNSLKELTDRFSNLGICIDLSIQDDLNETLYDRKHLTSIIYRMCQEALTNSIRHGQAKNLSIIINLASENIKLHIFDDGKGCCKIVKNKGLTGMEERIKSVGGTITFGSGEEGGFNINAVLPI